MAFELPAPPNFVAVLDTTFQVKVDLTWDAYSPADNAGHQIAGYRLFRSQNIAVRGNLIADIDTLGPGAIAFTDSNILLEGDVFYTLVAVEPDTFGSRPFGEGGNVPFGV